MVNWLNRFARAISAYEVGNAELDDPEQFEYAIQQGRAIFTHNARDFEPLIGRYFAQAREHFGLIISEQLPVGVLLRRLLRLFDSVSADEMKNNFRNLGEFK
ncbi:MAG: DUF5615 family PIN-like protein [Chloroflexi bacterium]|nr:DUF5615 family PIN-like protein [Chloroflexota bacterium]